MKVLIMAGGTGGHIFPALAVANELKARGVTVHWLGTKTGMESKIVADAGYPFHAVSAVGVRRTGWRQRFTAPFSLCAALLSALAIMRQVKPDVVLGLGGYASAPGGLAAWLCRIPLIIHEQNAVPGLTNRKLQSMATLVLSAFPNTFPKRRHRPAHVVGNPVRKPILALPLKATRQPRHLRLLMLGGSQGAAALNALLPQALACLLNNNQGVPIEIWHITGVDKYEDTRTHYRQFLTSSADTPNPVKIDPFCDDMAAAYDWANIVLCRAGAMTVSELAAVGLPSILVPYPHAVDDHQTVNADYLAGVGAAVLVQQSALTIETLAKKLQYFCDNLDALNAMARAAQQVSKRDATRDVVDLILGCVQDTR